MRGDWAEKKFGEVCEIVGGSQPPKSEFISEPKDGYIRLIQVRDYKTDKYITYIPRDKAKRFCNKTDLMIGRYGPPIFGIFRGLEGAYNVALMKAIPREEIISKAYFYWFLQNRELVRFVEQTSKRAAGQDGVRKERLYEYPVPVPPLPEQERIVAILDKAFEGIDQAIAHTEQNLASARELFESYLNNIFTQRGDDWVEKKLKNLCVKITDGVHKKPTYVDDGVPFIKINNLTVGVGISFDDVSYITQEDHELFCKRTHPEKGDLLITKDGTIGIVRLIETDRAFSIFVSVALIKPVDKGISPYLKYVLESPLIQNQINPQGAALKHLYLRDLREYTIPIPSSEEQQRIVELLDAITTRTQRLESLYTQKLESLKELKQSLLKQAFAGELT